MVVNFFFIYHISSIAIVSGLLFSRDGVLPSSFGMQPILVPRRSRQGNCCCQFSRFVYKYYRKKQKCLWLLSEMLISEIAHILGTLYRTFVIIQYLLNYAAFWPHKGRTTLLFDYNRLNDHFI